MPKDQPELIPVPMSLGINTPANVMGPGYGSPPPGYNQPPMQQQQAYANQTNPGQGCANQTNPGQGPAQGYANQRPIYPDAAQQMYAQQVYIMYR